MQRTYYKAIRPDGTDFYTGTVRWAPEDEPAQPGSVVRHPWAATVGLRADSYLSASTVATDCTGMRWPCRLLEVKAVGKFGLAIEPVTPVPDLMPNKRAAIRWRIVRELDPMLALGPQAEQIVALLERAGRLTQDEIADLAAHYGDPYVEEVWSAAGETARVNHRAAAWWATRVPSNVTSARAVVVVSDAAQALVVRDLIGQDGLMQEHYDLPTGPWRRIIGPIHPDDEPPDMATPA